MHEQNRLAAAAVIVVQGDLAAGSIGVVGLEAGKRRFDRHVVVYSHRRPGDPGTGCDRRHAGHVLDRLPDQLAQHVLSLWVAVRRAYADLCASAEAIGLDRRRMAIVAAVTARASPTRWAAAYPEPSAPAASAARATTPSPASASRTWETSPSRVATSSRITPPMRPAPSDIPMVRAKA